MPRQYTVRQPITPIGPSIAYVPLTRGFYALIDSDDAALFVNSAWNAWKPKNGQFYAKRRNVMMHTAITGRIFIDHANGNTLDNRRFNLRSADRSQNAYNSKLRGDNTSGFRGVSPVLSGKWLAEIWHKGRKHNLGRHLTPEDAYAAYCQAAEMFAREFRRAK